MVGSDLYLDGAKGATLKKGDAVLQTFASRNERLKHPGLIFESPVFVNGSVHLPQASTVQQDATRTDTIYTPVTFKDKVILGGGPVMRNGEEFSPRTAGDLEDQFWSNIRQFGGFKKGWKSTAPEI